MSISKNRISKSLDVLIRAAVIATLLLPVVLVLVLSFSGDEYIVFPPKSWGLRHYNELFSSVSWLNGLTMSLMTTIPAALLATLIGVPAVLAINRSRYKVSRSALQALGISPLILPGVAYAVALYVFYIKIKIMGTYTGVVFANTMLALPFVIMIVGAGLKRVPRDLELAAMSLGASERQATIGITLRLLIPSIIAAFALAFTVAFDEAVLINFIGGSSIRTLPRMIYDSIQNGIDPIVAAVASVLTVLTGIIFFITYQLRRQKNGSVQ